jgi:hypothetical protein
MPVVSTVRLSIAGLSSATAPVDTSFRSAITSRMALLMPAGEQPSEMSMDWISVLLLFVAE